MPLSFLRIRRFGHDAGSVTDTVGPVPPPHVSGAPHTRRTHGRPALPCAGRGVSALLWHIKTARDDAELRYRRLQAWAHKHFPVHGAVTQRWSGQVLEPYRAASDVERQVGDYFVFEYGRGDGISVTGGFVYRGTRLGAAYRGRYFFADYSGRVWSIALTIDAPHVGGWLSNGTVTYLGGTGTASVSR